MSAGMRQNMSARYLRTRSRCWTSYEGAACVIRIGLPSSSKLSSGPCFIPPLFHTLRLLYVSDFLRAEWEYADSDDRAHRYRRTRRRRHRRRRSEVLSLRQERQDRRERGDGYARRGAVWRGVPGDQGRKARIAGLPGLQEDLRQAQEVAVS